MIYISFVTLHFFVGVFVSASVTDSMRKAQEENSAHVLAKAIKVCEERNVIKYRNFNYTSNDHLNIY